MAKLTNRTGREKCNKAQNRLRGSSHQNETTSKSMKLTRETTTPWKHRRRRPPTTEGSECTWWIALKALSNTRLQPGLQEIKHLLVTPPPRGPCWTTFASSLCGEVRGEVRSDFDEVFYYTVLVRVDKVSRGVRRPKLSNVSRCSSFEPV